MASVQQKIVPSISSVNLELLRRSLEVSLASTLNVSPLKMIENDIIGDTADHISSRIIKYSTPSLTEVKMNVTCLDAVHSKIVDYTILYRYHDQSASYITQKVSFRPSRDISKDVLPRISTYSDQFISSNINHMKAYLLSELIDKHDEFMARHELVSAHLH